MKLWTEEDYLNTPGYNNLHKLSRDWNYSEFSIDKEIIDILLNVTDRILEKKSIEEFEDKHNYINSEVIDYLNDIIKYYIDDNLSKINHKMDWSLFDIGFASQWVNQMFKYEYNPLHTHVNCLLSSVLVLKVPEFGRGNLLKRSGTKMRVEKEREGDIVKFLPHPSFKDGALAFVRSTGDSLNDITSVTVEPNVGKFYLFPSNMNHMVYPFYSNSERRTMAFNINVINKREIV